MTFDSQNFIKFQFDPSKFKQRNSENVKRNSCASSLISHECDDPHTGVPAGQHFDRIPYNNKAAELEGFRVTLTIEYLTRPSICLHENQLLSHKILSIGTDSSVGFEFSNLFLPIEEIKREMKSKSPNLTFKLVLLGDGNFFIPSSVKIIRYSIISVSRVWSSYKSRSLSANL